MGRPALHAFHQRVWSIALVVHVITAWFSSGYYAADEHYQIISFAQAKLGELPVGDLPWEYEAHIRSAFLPGLAYLVIGVSRALITVDPFHIAFLLRPLTALFALVVVRSFVRAAMPQLTGPLHRPFILLSYLLWFLPYQHVRFATETWSGLLFLYGLSHVIGEQGHRWRLFMAGLCFGLSLQVKPAMGIVCLCAIAWMLVNRTPDRSAGWRLALGVLLALVFGALVDRWFYGAFTATTWNFVQTAIAGDPRHVFEEYPWYYYFPWIVKYAIPPIGALLVCGLAWLSIRRPRSPLVWCVWPYLVVLSAIPHKEVRFLFTLVDLVPLLLVLAWEEVSCTAVFTAMHGRWTQRTMLACMVVLVVLNTAGLVVAGTTAAGSGRSRLAEVIWNIHPSDPITLGYTMEEPYIWRVRIPPFYLPWNVSDAGSYDPCSMAPADSVRRGTTLLIGPEEDAASTGCVPEISGYHIIARSEPVWATATLTWYNSDRQGPYVLYHREPTPSHPSAQ